MTAEIIIMNKTAVALAADSKVTVTSGGIGKTFDTVNKVFTLSKVHPVGLMIFGSAEFVRCPWETIVKLYRSSKKSHSFPTVEQWGQDFIHFVRQFDAPVDEEKKRNIQVIASDILLSIRAYSREQARTDGALPGSPQYKDIIRNRVERLLSHLGNLSTFDSKYMSTIRRLYGSVVNELCDKYFDRVVDDPLKRQLVNYVFKHLQSEKFSDFSTGIVITGFGDDEIFPAVAHYETDGYIGPQVKIKRDQIIKVDRSTSSCVVPFAQKEMVQRFMEGIDPSFHQFLQSNFKKLLEESCLDVLARYGSATHKTPAIEKAIKSAVSKSWRENFSEAATFQRTQFTSPIVQMVSMLPKDELPHLAESLVALTSLKRHVSHDDETVGGPIDVALISKNDGFVWIKRKHYFPPDLNPHFAQNYRRDIGEDNANEKAPNVSKAIRRPRAIVRRKTSNRSRSGA